MTKSRSRLEIWARSRSRRLRSRLHHCCAANKLRGTFDQCSVCSKKHFISSLLHANVCLPIVDQIHADQYEALTCCI